MEAKEIMVYTSFLDARRQKGRVEKVKTGSVQGPVYRSGKTGGLIYREGCCGRLERMMPVWVTGCLLRLPIVPKEKIQKLQKSQKLISNLEIYIYKNA